MSSAILETIQQHDDDEENLVTFEKRKKKSVKKKTVDYEEKFLKGVKKDLIRVASIYIDSLIDSVGGYSGKRIAYRKDYMMKLITKKLECLVMALYEGSKEKWFGLLQKDDEGISEGDFYDKCFKMFRRMHHCFGIEEGRRSKMRTLSRLILSVS